MRRDIELALGSPAVDDRPAPWGDKNSTTVTSLADGREVVVQEYRDRAAGGRRVDAMLALRPLLDDAGIRIPRVLAHGAGWAVT